MGIVYVVTNPAMPDMVKIGRTTRTIEERLRSLDTTGVPVPFECVGAWEFEDPVKVEASLHKAFADRRVRKTREFFRIRADQPIAILETFGAKDVTPQDDIVDEKNAADDRASLEVARSRRERFRLDAAEIKPGTILESVWDDDGDITCTVAEDGRQVEFEGKVMSLSAAAKTVLHAKGKIWKAVSGPDSWRYRGKTLTEIRDEKQS